MEKGICASTSSRRHRVLCLWFLKYVAKREVTLRLAFHYKTDFSPLFEGER